MAYHHITCLCFKKIIYLNRIVYTFTAKLKFVLMNLKKFLKRLDEIKMYDQNHHNDNYRPSWMGNTKYSNDSPKYWTSKTQKRLTNVSYITGPSSQENEYNQTRYNQNHPKTMKKEQMKLKNGMSLFSTLKMQFTDYCEHSTLHGLRYVGDQRMSIIER